MLKIVSTAQIREIDRRAIEEYGIPELLLMENAGLQAVRVMEERYGPLDGKRIGIFCGKGNNGGDGFVMARHLHQRGIDVAVYLLAEKTSLKGNAKLNMEVFHKSGGRIKEMKDETDIRKHKIAIRHADILVDALLGTGLNAELGGMYKTAVEKIHDWGRYVFAVDIPTGLCSDRGAVFGLHVKASSTVTFGFPKVGMMFHPAYSACGKLTVVNIGFPDELLGSSPFHGYLLDNAYARDLLPAPVPDAHKGTFGHAVVCGGSVGMGGAVALASLAALKVGAGLSTVAVHDRLVPLFEVDLPEVMAFPAGDQWSTATANRVADFVKEKSALLIGPGMGQSDGGTAFVKQLLSETSVPVILDADGLNNAAKEPTMLKREAPLIVTPHPGEMSRLTGLSTQEINSDRLKVAKDFSAQYGCVTVLKGARTVVALPDGTAYVNPTGNPNLATGGTGDVLAGMIVGLVARGLSAGDSACLAVYLHGMAADIYTEEKGNYSMTASDLVGYLPAAIRRVMA